MAEFQTWRMPAGALPRPLVIAHRGASATAPENTLAAFRLAVEAGADGVELDARLTRDGEVAVLHDRSLERTAGRKDRIGAIASPELRSLDAGSWFHPRFRGERVPLLREVFEALPGGFLINVELKAEGIGVRALALRVVSLVREYRRWESTLVASSNPLALAAARVFEPRLSRGCIWSRKDLLPFRQRWFSFLAHPHWMNPDRHTLTPGLLTRLQRRGQRVLAWDVDVLQDGPSLPVDAILTDNPAEWIRTSPPGPLS